MKKRILLSLLLALVTAGLAIGGKEAKAATYYVNPGESIQDVIDNPNVVDGDEIIVLPGTYYENISMKDGITLNGSGADVTTINGGGNGHVVVFNSASGLISDFTITNSGTNPVSNAGIYGSNSTINIKNNIIENNRYGISIFSNSNYIITGNKIDNNTAEGIKVSDSNGVISNNIITANRRDGIKCFDSSPLIINNTITSNASGLSLDPTTTQIITNNIITSNEIGILAHCTNDPPSPLLQISYNNVWDNSFANYWEDYGPIDFGEHVSQPFTPFPGTGEIHQPPIFVGDENYYLKSEGWRWDSEVGRWDYDDVTSRCIDAGNPGSPLENELLSVPYYPNNEWGVNLRINMGAYGGTEKASMPPYDWAILADLTNDGIVDYIDLGHWVENWLETYSGRWSPSDLNRNGVVDMFDFALFGQDWPVETSWHTP